MFRSWFVLRTTSPTATGRSSSSSSSSRWLWSVSTDRRRRRRRLDHVIGDHHLRRASFSSSRLIYDNNKQNINQDVPHHHKEQQQGEEDDEEEDLPLLQADEDQKKKRLDVAIVGYPNAGKSQLLNSLLGTKVAAVSRKRHTTRNGIWGVRTDVDSQSQLVFVDTPGFMTTTTTGETVTRDLSMSVKHHLVGVDHTLVVVDAAKRNLAADGYMDTLYRLLQAAAFTATQNNIQKKGPKFSLVLNKVDLVKPKSDLLKIAETFGSLADRVISETLQLQLQQQQQQQQQLQQEVALPEVFYTCAKGGHKDEGVQDVYRHLVGMAIPQREWLLPESHQVTPMDFPARVEEILREKIYRTCHREVPHRIRQRNRQLELVRGDSHPHNSVVLIEQDLIVDTKSHMNLLLHNNQNSNLQRIHDAAVPELRRIFQCEVLLTLHVKLVKRNRRR